MMKNRFTRHHEQRLRAYDLLVEMKSSGISSNETIELIHSKYNLPLSTLKPWYSGKVTPWGRKGKLVYGTELLYVIGALLGDGCLYRWRITHNKVIISGDERFCKKFADIVFSCIQKKTKAYPNRTRNHWFVSINNYKLYELFKKIRADLGYIETLIERHGWKSGILFIEGFFDAEGCVKIVKEKVRKTPKICLDFTNSNYAIMEVVKKSLKSFLNIDARYSVQEPKKHWKSNNKKTSYHLRIYKKEYVKKFFENISTTKLTKEKIAYVVDWLRTKNKSKIKLDCSFLQPASN